MYPFAVGPFLLPIIGHQESKPLPGSGSTILRCSATYQACSGAHVKTVMASLCCCRLCVCLPFCIVHRRDCYCSLQSSLLRAINCACSHTVCSSESGKQPARLRCGRHKWDLWTRSHTYLYFTMTKLMRIILAKPVLQGSIVLYFVPLSRDDYFVAKKRQG